jgi:hypothetical protein
MASLSPAEISALKSALVAAQALAAEAQAENARLAAEARDSATLITVLKLEIAKLQHQIYGQRSERKARLLEQLELELEELEAQASADELAAEQSPVQTIEVQGFTRQKPSRKPFPAHLPRERVVIEGPTTCACCGSDRLRKLGEDITETLEVIPRQWKVIQTVREKLSCRDCEKISQAPAPFHVTPRGWAGPSLLAGRRAQLIHPGRSGRGLRLCATAAL